MLRPDRMAAVKAATAGATKPKTIGSGVGPQKSHAFLLAGKEKKAGFKPRSVCLLSEIATSPPFG